MTIPAILTSPGMIIKVEQEDSTIKSEFTAGYVNRRARYTRRRDKWSYEKAAADSTAVLELQTFYDDELGGGADSFDWVNPIDSETYTVYFEKPPVYETIIKRDGVTWYKVSEIILVEQ